MCHHFGRLVAPVRGSRRARVTAEGGLPARVAHPMAPAARAPRMSQFVVALCVSLRATGMSLRKIAEHHLVKKRDGTSPSQQAVALAVKSHKSARRSASWRLNGAGKKKSMGRPKKITKSQVKKIDQLVKKKPGVVRAPHLKKKLHFTVSRQTGPLR